MSGAERLMTTLPWLHPRRAEVLAALALAVRLREPLAEGLARLAEHDPALRPWLARLAPDLRAGGPLGALLRRHRLVDRQAAERLDRAADPVAEFARLTRRSCAPLRGLRLIRWFPVVLMGALCLPLAVLQLSGVAGVFVSIFLELGIRLPQVTMALVGTRGSGLLLLVIACTWTAALLVGLSALRGLRHLPRLWWVEVRRGAALLELVAAARSGADRPLDLRGPAAWLAGLGVSAWRQGRPGWDRAWRTYRVLTRWRAPGADWRLAARATTAAGVLQALGLLGGGGDEELRHLERTLEERLRHALEPARAQAIAVLMVALGIGFGTAVLALFQPLVMVVQTLGQQS